jgi:DNA-binding transcriptional regulator LsrR (DeoR family)
MKGVELYAQVRYAVQIEGISRREAARRFGIDPRTVAKMLAFSNIRLTTPIEYSTQARTFDLARSTRSTQPRWR